MDLCVDDSGQDRKAPGVDRLAGAGARQIANLGDFFADDPDITGALAIVINHDAAFQDEIKVSRHWPIHCLGKESCAP